MSATPPDDTPRLPRGVYWLDGVRDEQGHEMLIAIDRTGRWIAPPTRVFRHDKRSSVIRMLRRRLDQVDPPAPAGAARDPPHRCSR